MNARLLLMLTVLFAGCVPSEMTLDEDASTPGDAGAPPMHGDPGDSGTPGDPGTPPVNDAGQVTDAGHHQPSNDAGHAPADAGHPSDAGHMVADAGSASCGAGEIAAGGACLPEPPVAAAPGKQWEVVFDEEFNGTTYDTTKLTPCFDWNSGGCTSSFNQGYEHYEPSQVQVADGIGKLIAAPLSPAISDGACFNGSCTYKSGLLSTARPMASGNAQYLFTFTYGYVEASLKVFDTQGFFTAFWMLPADPSYSYDTEIDILEALGSDPTDMEMHYSYSGRSQSYTPNYSPNKNGACASLDYSKAFHRFGVDWQPSHIAFYIDGVKCGQFTNASQIGSAPMQIILDVMVSNSWERSVGKPLLDSTLVRELDVDYLRVYQQN